MKQITEDYVSYEIAVLLKEKGFDIPCKQAYFNGSLVDYTLYGFCDGELLNCPSQSLALKWLREVNKIYINFDIHWLHFANQNGWMYVIERILDNGVDYIDSKGDENDATFFSTYEQAVEAAILYVLKNLI